MRRIILAMLLLAGLGGCGTDADQRLQITDALREHCPGASDLEIRIILNYLERRRLDGDSYDNAVYSVNKTCSENDSSESIAECRSCAIAIIDQLYPF